MVPREEMILQEWDLTQIINGKELRAHSPKYLTTKRIQRILDGLVESENSGEIYNASLDDILEENIQPRKFILWKKINTNYIQLPQTIR